MAKADSTGGVSTAPARPVPLGRRILFSLLALLVILAILHSVWTHLEMADVHRDVARIRAAGEPITAVDLAALAAGQGVYDDGLNAVIDLRRAATRVSAKGSSWEAWSRDAQPRLPLTAAEAAAVEAFAAEYASVFDDVRRATTKPAVDWKIAYTSPVLFTKLPDVKNSASCPLYTEHRAAGTASHSANVHTWSASPAAIAGVRGRVIPSASLAASVRTGQQKL